MSSRYSVLFQEHRYPATFRAPSQSWRVASSGFQTSPNVTALLSHVSSWGLRWRHTS